MSKPDPAGDAFLGVVVLCMTLITGAMISLLKKQRIAFETVTDRLRAYEPEAADIVDGELVDVQDAPPPTAEQRFNGHDPKPSVKTARSRTQTRQTSKESTI